MTNLVKTGSNWLSRQRERFNASTVFYKRGESAISLPAGRGRSTFDVVGGIGVGSMIETDDFIIRVDRLVIDGQPVEPAPGDRIIVGELEDGEVFEVRPRAGIPAWRYATANRVDYRIFTHHVGATPPDP